MDIQKYKQELEAQNWSLLEELRNQMKRHGFDDEAVKAWVFDLTKISSMRRQWYEADLTGDLLRASNEFFGKLEASREPVQTAAPSAESAPVQTAAPSAESAVKIPRRVVYDGGNSWDGRMGTILRENGDSYEVLPDDKTTRGISWCVELWPVQDVVHIKLSKAEQARLLLERLSREAWEGVERKAMQTLFHLTKEGCVESLPYDVHRKTYNTPAFASLFPSFESTFHAAGEIHRAGLAWWEGAK